MWKLFYLYLFTSSLLFSFKMSTSSQIEWNILQTEPIWIGWVDYNNSKWVKAVTIIPSKIVSVQKIIEDKKNYPKVFKRIEKINLITDEIVHIVLDMPFPFYGRDYIVSYNQYSEDDAFIYKYTSVDSLQIPIYKDYIRLINASGEWVLDPVDSLNTKVTYLWNGELLGDFPNWALKTAWETQGNEVFTWLKEAIE